MEYATWKDLPKGLVITAFYFAALPVLLIIAVIRYLAGGR